MGRILISCEWNGSPEGRYGLLCTELPQHPCLHIIPLLIDMDTTHARTTGAWRPHTGSTRHRYASAIDITHIQTTVTEGQGQRHDVGIWFHNQSPPPRQTHSRRQLSKPLRAGNSGISPVAFTLTLLTPELSGS